MPGRIRNPLEDRVSSLEEKVEELKMQLKKQMLDVRKPGDIYDRVRKLEKRVERLERSRYLRADQIQGTATKAKVRR